MRLFRIAVLAAAALSSGFLLRADAQTFPGQTNPGNYRFKSTDSITGTQVPTVRTLSTRFGVWRDVRDYGADGTCGDGGSSTHRNPDAGDVDDTAAIQAAIDAAVSSGGNLFIPRGRYCITSLDFTEMSFKQIISLGTFYATDSDADAVLDFLGANAIRADSITLFTQTGVSPRIGVQVGRNSNSGNSHVFEHWRILGDFDLAAFTMTISDFSIIIGSDIENESTSDTAYAMVRGDDNYHTFYSPFEDTPSNGDNARLIQSISKANPGVVTTQSTHNIPNGTQVRIRDAEGMVEINSTLKDTPADTSTTYCSANGTATTFQLKQSNCSTNLDTSGGGYTAHTAGTGKVGPVDLAGGSSHQTFMNTRFVHDAGPAVLLTGGNQGVRFINCYIVSEDVTAPVVTFYDTGSVFGNLDFFNSMETGDTLTGFQFRGESSSMTVESLRIKDSSPNVGGPYLSSVAGMTVNLIGFEFEANDNNSWFGITNGTFNVNGISMYTGNSSGTTTLDGFPDLYNGVLTTTDGNDLEFAAGSALIIPKQWGSTTIDYLPFKGGARFIGEADEFMFVARVSTASNGALATCCDDGSSIDGITVETGDTVLLTAQSTPSENGLYTAPASGAPTRLTTADTGAEIHGTYTTIQEGTRAGRIYKNTNASEPTVDVTDLTFERYEGLHVSSEGIIPVINDQGTLGASALGLSDLFLAEGGVIDWDNGDVTLTQTSNSLAIAGGLLATPSSALTIASGVVTATQSYHVIDTEAAGATDDLDTISGGVSGAHLYLRAADDARTVVIKDGTGNIQGAGDCTLDNTQDVAHLIYDLTLTAWLVVACAGNGA
jgi:hypothetical protein